jgi:hypothetical protein
VLNLTMNSAYVLLGPMKANIFDFVAILSGLLAMAYITYKAKPNASELAELDFAGKIISGL